MEYVTAKEDTVQMDHWIDHIHNHHVVTDETHVHCLDDEVSETGSQY